MAAADNATLAERLETLASLLDLAGASTTACAPTGARPSSSARRPPRSPSSCARGRVRELRGIGRRSRRGSRARRDRAARRDRRARERGAARARRRSAGSSGSAPKRMVELGRALGIRTAAELRDARAAGRLREVPGIGPSTEAKIRAALERPRAGAAARPVLNRAWALVGVDRRRARRRARRRPAPLGDSRTGSRSSSPATTPDAVIDRFARAAARSSRSSSATSARRSA